MLLFISFFLCAGIIFFAGTRLSLYSDVIAEKTGLGRTWIGLVLVASITSLPEMVNSIASVTYAGVPDIAAGDLIGSCVFNLLIIAFLDLLYHKAPISSVAQTGHIISGSFGILQLSVIIVAIFLNRHMPVVGWIGINSIISILIYLSALRLTYQYERKLINNETPKQDAELYPDIPLKRAICLFVINAFLVIGAAIFLPKIGDGIAELTGLGQTFVGNIFIALSTSLPEAVVCFGALKCKAVDLAMGNLMGSTIFNIAILGFADILYTNGPILCSVSQNHIISAISAIVITAIVTISLTYRVEKKLLPLSVDAILIVSVYVINVILLYMLR
ncbi:MAG: sodium:calcium antiporter [candidate division WOR-3 bacterium]